MSFKSLTSQLRVGTERIARFELNTIESGGKTPTLLLRYAGEGNAGYTNAVLKLVNEDRGGKAGGKVSLAKIAADREQDVPIFAQYVIAGWENFHEDSGESAPCTPDKVEEFLRSLIEKQPDGSTAADVFDKIRAFAKNAENFRGSPDGDALGKG